MKIAHVVADLLTSLSTATSVQSGLDLALRRLLRLSGADAGALVSSTLPAASRSWWWRAARAACPTSSRPALLSATSPRGDATGRRARGAAASARGARSPAGAMVRRIALGPTRGRWAGSC